MQVEEMIITALPFPFSEAIFSLDIVLYVAALVLRVPDHEIQV
jgi:hypothetical protein